MSGRAWIVVACGALMVLTVFGVRMGQNVFLVPMETSLDGGRATFALAVAVGHLVVGLAQPFVGMVADRHGSGWVAFVGALFFGGGIALSTITGGSAPLFVLTMGALTGTGMAMCFFGPVMGAVARAVPAERRAFAFGIVTAAASLGMLALVPAAKMLAEVTADWRVAFLILSGSGLVIALLAVGIAGRPAAASGGAAVQSLGAALSEALGHSGFRLLAAGYFVCGFHVAFIGTHLPAYLNDFGLQTGATALALIGAFNILGSYAFGFWGDRVRKKYLLCGIYLGRAAVITAFIVTPPSALSAILFAAAMGFLWLGTVPLTNGLVAQIFGVRYLSTLGGIVFLSHQLGSFLGAWLGGLAYEQLGSYESVWWASVALGLFSALVHWPIRDQPVARPVQPLAVA